MNISNIILTGFMGVGKSIVGQLLAEHTGRQFVDTDQWIQGKTNKSIDKIFFDNGESTFRQWEETVAVTLSQTKNHVIATGGKLMLDPANALDLGRTGVVLCLTAEPKTILTRLMPDGTQRPLLTVADPVAEVQRLLLERANGYARFPQIMTDHKMPALIVKEIVEGLQHSMWSPYNPKSHTLTVSHPNGSYPVIVGKDLLPHLRELAMVPHMMVLITDENVAPLYAGRCQADLVIKIPAGEQHKHLDTVRWVYEQMLDAGIDRSATIVALGGGVVGDIAGFVAATYMRGINFVQCPTSLLSMVDASVGGKTGVDMPQGKNLIGAFKQPQAVLVDVETAITLPHQEFCMGMSEVIKHGLIASPALLQQILINEWSQPDTNQLYSLLIRAIQVKQRIVEADPYEGGDRTLLNLGHTFGHAIEQVSEYKIRHGEGVAMGLGCAIDLSIRMGYCEPALLRHLELLLNKLQLPNRIPRELPINQILMAMEYDKKRTAGKIRFVLLRGLAQPFVTSNVSREAVEATLQARQT